MSEFLNDASAIRCPPSLPASARLAVGLRRLRRERGRLSAGHRDSAGAGSHHVQPARGAHRVRQLHGVPSPGRGRAISADELSRCQAAGQGHRRGDGRARDAALEGRARRRRVRQRAAAHRRADRDHSALGRRWRARRRRRAAAAAAALHRRLAARSSRSGRDDERGVRGAGQRARTCIGASWSR